MDPGNDSEMAPLKLDYFLANRPLDNGVYSGDTGMVKEFDNMVFLAVIDALGHGKVAHELAETCTDFLAENYRNNLVAMMEGLHHSIQGSRGVVASLCLLDMGKGVLSYVSVGDTLVRKLNNDRSRIYSMPGIVGYEIRTIKEGTMQLEDNDILLLHTDGVQSNFDPRNDDMLHGDSRSIANNIIARYGKKHDDALCIVLRYRK